MDTGITGQQTFTVNDIPSSLKGKVHNQIATMPASVNNGAENFDTIEVAFNKRFAQGFFLDSSYDYTRSDALVNNAASTSPLTQSDPIATGRYVPSTPAPGSIPKGVCGSSGRSAAKDCPICSPSRRRTRTTRSPRGRNRG